MALLGCRCAAGVLPFGVVRAPYQVGHHHAGARFMSCWIGSVRGTAVQVWIVARFMTVWGRAGLMPRWIGSVRETCVRVSAVALLMRVWRGAEGRRVRRRWRHAVLSAGTCLAGSLVGLTASTAAQPLPPELTRQPLAREATSSGLTHCSVPSPPAQPTLNDRWGCWSDVDCCGTLHLHVDRSSALPLRVWDWVVSMRACSRSQSGCCASLRRLQVQFPDRYPLESPEVVFLPEAPVHPHIYSNGHICLDIL
eukprot:355528-Chlamydomonas_euryale.AAC.9